MTAAEWLARTHAVTDPATPGPWEHHEPRSVSFLADVRVSGEWGPQQGVAYRVDRPADAAFIAASRTMLPAAVAAIEAVLAKHRSSTDHPAGFLPYCVECWEAGGMDGAPTWPCPTVRAIAAHLDPA